MSRLVYVGLLCLALAMQACVSSSEYYQEPLVYRVTIHQGESLAEIATRYDTTWQAIVAENELQNPAQIKPGMRIRVRPGPGGYIAGTETATKPQPKSSKRRGLLFGNEEATNPSFVWPVRGRRITSKFGRRRGRPHEGIDLGGAKGEPVFAAAAGIVEFAARNKSYGRTVVIRHNGTRTLYAHLNSIDVDEGDEVHVAQQIGEVGTTGHARGPHLHFEIRDAANRPIDPLPHLNRSSQTLISAK